MDQSFQTSVPGHSTSPDLCSVEEVASALGIDSFVVYRLLSRKALRCSRDSFFKIAISRKDIADLLKPKEAAC